MCETCVDLGIITPQHNKNDKITQDMFLKNYISDFNSRCKVVAQFGADSHITRILEDDHSIQRITLLQYPAMLESSQGGGFGFIKNADSSSLGNNAKTFSDSISCSTRSVFAKVSS